MRTIKLTNGCSPDVNAASFTKTFQWYDQPLALEQVAAELGLSVDETVKTLSANKNLSARLGSLAFGGTIPRAAFEQEYLPAYDFSHPDQERGSRRKERDKSESVTPVEKPQSQPRRQIQNTRNGRRN